MKKSKQTKFVADDKGLPRGPCAIINAKGPAGSISDGVNCGQVRLYHAEPKCQEANKSGMEASHLKVITLNKNAMH